jgi:hypothetical protein
MPIFESFATFEKSFTGRHRYPNIGETAPASNNAPVWRKR